MRRVYIKGLVISYRSLVTLHWKNQSREIELYGQGFTPLSPGVCVRQSFDDELRCGSHIVRLDGSTRRGALGILTALDTKLARSKARIIPSTGTLAAPLAQGAEVNLVFRVPPSLSPSQLPTSICTSPPTRLHFLDLIRTSLWP